MTGGQGKPGILVLGSLNMDLVVRVAKLPAGGETVLGDAFQMIPGGKGANQAYAAGKLAGRSAVKMIGRVGCDPFGEKLKSSLAAARVDVAAIESTAAAPTGIAMIAVDDAGQNTIVVALGANGLMTPGDVDASVQSFTNAGFLLLQLEVPLSAIARALSLAAAHNVRTILDPAPAQPLEGALLAGVDILTPNESEACVLLGRPARRVNEGEAATLGRELLALGPKAVLLKLGDGGSLYIDAGGEVFQPAFRVQAVDATAAGDTFNAGLAVALSEGLPIRAAQRFAAAAAAISVTRHGAQSSAPAREEVDHFLAGAPVA